MSEMGSAEKYMEFYRKKSGRQIIKKELEFIERRLGNCRKILSIGCGPAVVETDMKKLHPDTEITGIDISPDMLGHAPKSVHVVNGDGQNMGFRDETFDCILYLTSLEFIPNCEKAVEEAHRVLKQKGKILVMMLNPESQYFAEKYGDRESYIRKNIKHTDINVIRDCIKKRFWITSEMHFLKIKGEKITESADWKTGSLYVLEGIKDGK
jgi:ubiquinone/menaquinone biosynthesis C-methylase UbiE